jgi:hypothetical protein
LFLHSFSLTCYSALFARPIVLLFLLNMLFHSSCSTYCFTPLVWLVALLLLLNLQLYFFCSTCYFVLSSTCCFVQPIVLLFLLDLFIQVPFCYAHDFATLLFLFDLFTQSTSLLCLWFCCSLFLLLNIVALFLLFEIDTFPLPFTFLQVWSVEELIKFEFFNLDLEGENFCFQVLFVHDFF